MAVLLLWRWDCTSSSPELLLYGLIGRIYQKIWACLGSEFCWKISAFAVVDGILVYSQACFINKLLPGKQRELEPTKNLLVYLVWHLFPLSCQEKYCKFSLRKVKNPVSREAIVEYFLCCKFLHVSSSQSHCFFILFFSFMFRKEAKQIISWWVSIWSSYRPLPSCELKKAGTLLLWSVWKNLEKIAF